MPFATEMNSKLNDRDIRWIAGKAEDTLDVVLRKYGKDVRTVTEILTRKETKESKKKKDTQQEFLYEDVGLS